MATQKLTKEDRGRIAEKVMEWGNLMFVGLVIAQFVPEGDPVSIPLILLGLIGMGGAYSLARSLMKGGVR